MSGTAVMSATAVKAGMMTGDAVMSAAIAIVTGSVIEIAISIETASASTIGGMAIIAALLAAGGTTTRMRGGGGTIMSVTGAVMIISVQKKVGDF